MYDCPEESRLWEDPPWAMIQMRCLNFGRKTGSIETRITFIESNGIRPHEIYPDHKVGRMVRNYRQ
ncbi:hypothetical protein GYMLUDRAFT_48233 [Collybiopsis luxurians FD-317 M1]|uniref:Uncharacterized protein n=1 Tax=Collybiopsis luxurians FD-317 M1 TaxID=944289 RepID=A0A0D0CAK6_9AGAR|nr:hypothetical protein GYMLUDRAFT_48233 [Collybiopsis luxurians FD-317 M1]